MQMIPGCRNPTHLQLNPCWLWFSEVCKDLQMQTMFECSLSDDTVSTAPFGGLPQSFVDRHRRTEANDFFGTFPGIVHLLAPKMKFVRRRIKVYGRLRSLDDRWNTLQRSVETLTLDPTASLS